MKKLLAIFIALGMILSFSNPQAVSASGDGNWFADDFPVDIPFIG